MEAKGQKKKHEGEKKYVGVTFDLVDALMFVSYAFPFGKDKRGGTDWAGGRRR